MGVVVVDVVVVVVVVAVVELARRSPFLSSTYSALLEEQHVGIHS